VTAKLIPRLVPRPLWGKNLRTSLGGGWAALSKKIRKLAGDQCEICGGTSDDAPVRWTTCLDEVWTYDYENRTAYLADLKAICWWCNAITHFGFTMTNYPKHVDRALEHGARVNGLPGPHAMGQICVVHLDHHRQVSEHVDWTIDWDDWHRVVEEVEQRLLCGPP